VDTSYKQQNEGTHASFTDKILDYCPPRHNAISLSIPQSSQSLCIILPVAVLIVIYYVKQVHVSVLQIFHGHEEKRKP